MTGTTTTYPTRGERASGLAEMSTLRLLSLRLNRRLRRVAGVSLTPSQLSALAVLERHRELPMGRLADHEQVGKATLTRLVAKLESLGLVERRRDADDGRSWVIALTPYGVELTTEAGHRVDTYLARQLDALDPDDRQRILDAVPALERLLEVKA